MKRNAVQIVLNDAEFELMLQLKKAMRIKTGAQILRSALYALSEKKLTQTRNITNKTRLGELLCRRGIRQTELAKRLGVMVSSVNYHCINGFKTKRTAERYAAALQCRPEDLMEFAREGAPK